MDVEVVTGDDVRDVVCFVVVAAARDVGFGRASYELAQEGMGGPIGDVLLEGGVELAEDRLRALVSYRISSCPSFVEYPSWMAGALTAVMARVRACDSGVRMKVL